MATAGGNVNDTKAAVNAVDESPKGGPSNKAHGMSGGTGSGASGFHRGPREGSKK